MLPSIDLSRASRWHRLPQSAGLLGALLLCMAILGCTPVILDPSGGSEAVLIRTIEHPDLLDVNPARQPGQERVVLQTHTWTLLWRIPVNRPDFGIWLREELPPGSSAANIRATVHTPWYGHLVFFPTLGLVKVEQLRYEAEPVFLSDRPSSATP